MVIVYAIIIAFVLYLCVMLIPRSGDIKGYFVNCSRCGHKMYHHRNGTCSVYTKSHMCWCEKEK